MENKSNQRMNRPLVGSLMLEKKAQASRDQNKQLMEQLTQQQLVHKLMEQQGKIQALTERLEKLEADQRQAMQMQQKQHKASLRVQDGVALMLERTARRLNRLEMLAAIK